MRINRMTVCSTISKEAFINFADENNYSQETNNNDIIITSQPCIIPKLFFNSQSVN